MEPHARKGSNNAMVGRANIGRRVSGLRLMLQSVVSFGMGWDDDECRAAYRSHTGIPHALLIARVHPLTPRIRGPLTHYTALFCWS